MASWRSLWPPASSLFSVFHLQVTDMHAVLLSLPFAGLTRHIFFLNCRPCGLGFDASGRRQYFIGRDGSYRCRDGHGSGYGIRLLQGDLCGSPTSLCLITVVYNTHLFWFCCRRDGRTRFQRQPRAKAVTMRRGDSEHRRS
jgi:hypothetical protein